MKEFEIIIDPKTGHIDIDQIGFHGTECEEKLKDLFEMLGTVVHQDKKSEYYQYQQNNIRQEGGN